MLKRTLILLPFLLAVAGAHAQSTPAKKDLVARILKHQQSGIEGMARTLVEQPIAELLVNAGSVIQSRVPANRQEATGREIQADVQKYVAEATPLVQARAVALAPGSVGAMLEEKFTEDELKQVLAIMDSPVYSKFQRMGDELQRALADKVVQDTRPTIEPKLRALEQSVGKRISVASGGTAPAPAAAGPAPKPAPKAPAKQ